MPEYQQTAALWARGVLQHEFGVAPEDLIWYMERTEERSHGGGTGFQPPPGVRFHHRSNPPAGLKENETNVGFVVGGNFNFGLVGIHLAYDSEKFDDGKMHDVFGIGANVGLRVPLGM